MQDGVRVLIATTDGPIEIGAIIDLDPGETPIVALGSTADVVGDLQGPYRNFVARGSGIIAHRFGHDAFRLELSRAIHHGKSWQLAVFVAHALHRQGRLAETGERASAVVWATGEVDYQLRVAGIESLPLKLETSLVRFAAEGAGGARLLALWPAANDDEVSLATRTRLEALGVVVHVADQAEAILARLGIGEPPEPSRSHGSHLSRALPDANRLLQSAERDRAGHRGHAARLTGLRGQDRAGPSWRAVVAIGRQPAVLGTGAAIVAAGGAVFAALTPPWPRGLAAATPIVVGAAILLWARVLRSASPVLIKRCMLAGSIALGVAAATYLAVDDTFTFEMGDGTVQAQGYVCSPMALIVYKDQCPRLGLDARKDAEFQADRLWTTDSIAVVQVTLVMLWLAVCGAAALLAGCFQVLHRQVLHRQVLHRQVLHGQVLHPRMTPQKDALDRTGLPRR